MENSVKEILLDVNEKIANNQIEVNKAINEMVKLIINNMPDQFIETNIHPRRLKRMTLFHMRIFHGENSYSLVSCNGRDLKGCITLQGGE